MVFWIACIDEELCFLVLKKKFITFRVRRRRHEMFSGHAHLCVCLSVYVRGRMPTLLNGPGCNLGAIIGGAPQLCTIGRICNRCTGCVAMTTLHECKMSASACSRCYCHSLTYWPVPSKLVALHWVCFDM